jgi:hypothetical protein
LFIVVLPTGHQQAVAHCFPLYIRFPLYIHKSRYSSYMKHSLIYSVIINVKLSTRFVTHKSLS